MRFAGAASSIPGIVSTGIKPDCTSYVGSPKGIYQGMAYTVACFAYSGNSKDPAMASVPLFSPLVFYPVHAKIALTPTA